MSILNKLSGFLPIVVEDLKKELYEKHQRLEMRHAEGTESGFPCDPKYSERVRCLELLQPLAYLQQGIFGLDAWG